MKLELIVEVGVHQGLAFVTGQNGIYRIGRTDDAALALTKDVYVSREHCSIELTSGGAWLSDAGSSGGTYVNGKRIERAALGDGDTILVGRTALRVSVTGSEPAARTIERPRSVPGFTLMKQLPTDGPGEIWWAMSELSDRLVILHSVSLERPSSERETKRFMRQAGICARLQHPGLARFLTQGITANRLWYATELIEGVSLRKHVEKHGPVSEQEAIQIICHLLDIVTYLHQEEVVHRNLRPESVLVKRQSGAFTIHIADLGSAQCFHSAELQRITTLSQRSASVHAFTPPEVLIDFDSWAPYSDIYALGAILYFMLTGKDPYSAGVYDLATMILQGDPPLIQVMKSDLSEAVLSVVRRAMARDVHKRYDTAREMWMALHGLLIDSGAIDRLDEIDQQLQLLQAHRRRLRVLLEQEATLGSAHSPPGVIIDIEEACTEISRIKVVLRNWGIQVADMPGENRNV